MKRFLLFLLCSLSAHGAAVIGGPISGGLGGGGSLSNFFAGFVTTNMQVLVPGPGAFQTNTITLNGGTLVFTNAAAVIHSQATNGTIVIVTNSPTLNTFSVAKIAPIGIFPAAHAWS